MLTAHHSELDGGSGGGSGLGRRARTQGAGRGSIIPVVLMNA